jgi:heme/copper-type cytochrome/quinol oxidase subunit 2
MMLNVLDLFLVSRIWMVVMIAIFIIVVAVPIICYIYCIRRKRHRSTANTTPEINGEHYLIYPFHLINIHTLTIQFCP